MQHSYKIKNHINEPLCCYFMGRDTSYDLAYQLISDILSQQDIYSYQLTVEVVYLKQEWRKDYLLELERNGQL
jgi:hypothetical protein